MDILHRRCSPDERLKCQEERILLAQTLIARHRQLTEVMELSLDQYATEFAETGRLMDASTRAVKWHEHLDETEEIASSLRQMRNWSITEAVEVNAESPTALARRLKMTRTAVLKICRQTVASWPSRSS